MNLHFGLKLGDLVIATSLVESDNGKGGTMFHAKRGYLGHVIALTQGFCPTIFFERSKTVCDCDDTEVEFAGDADTGRYQTRGKSPT